MTTYLARLQAKVIEAFPDCRLGLSWHYAQLIQLATTHRLIITMQDVHDAWSAATSPARPEHPNLVPFGWLPTADQLRDHKYAAAFNVIVQRETAGE